MGISTSRNSVCIIRTSRDCTFMPKIRGPIEVSPDGKKIITVRSRNSFIGTLLYQNCKPFISITDLETYESIEVDIPGTFSSVMGIGAEYTMMFDEYNIILKNLYWKPVDIKINLENGQIDNDIHMNEPLIDKTLPKTLKRIFIVRNDFEYMKSYFEGSLTNEAHVLDENNNIIKKIVHGTVIRRCFVSNNGDFAFTDTFDDAKITFL